MAHRTRSLSGLGDRRLQIDRSGPFLASPHFVNTGFLSHSYGYGPANRAKTVFVGAKFGYAALRERFDAPSPTGS